MSWQIINKALGLAMIDEAFAALLLEDPRKALKVYNIHLPSEELDIICTCQAQTLYEFSQQLIEKLGPH